MDKLWLVIFSVLAGVLNYVLQIVVGRGLSVSEFGAFNTINSFATNAINIYLPLCVIACRITAENHGKLAVNRKIYAQLVAVISLLSALVVACAVLLTFLGVLGGESQRSVLWICFMLIVMAYYNYVFYVIQGMQLFLWYGFGSFLLAALKTLFSMASIRQGGGLGGVVVAISLGYGILVILGVCIIGRGYKKNDEKANDCFSPRYLLSLYSVTFVSQLVFSLYVYNGEILIMRPFYSESELGIYSSAALLGKASIYLCTILATIILPKIAEIKADSALVKRKYIQTMELCAGMSIVYALGFLLFGEMVIRLLFGDEYSGAKEYMWSLALLVFPMNMNILTYNFLLALNKIKEFTVGMVVSLLAVASVIVFLQPAIGANVALWAAAMAVNAIVGSVMVLRYANA